MDRVWFASGSLAGQAFRALDLWGDSPRFARGRVHPRLTSHCLLAQRELLPWTPGAVVGTIYGSAERIGSNGNFCFLACEVGQVLPNRVHQFPYL